MPTTYRRNPWLIPQWTTAGDANGRVELVDTRSGGVFRVEPAVLGLLNRLPHPTAAESIAFDGYTGQALSDLLERMTEAGILDTDRDGDHRVGAGDSSADLFADRGEWSTCELAVHAQSARGGKPQVRKGDIPPARLTHPEALATIPLPDHEPPSRTFAEVLESRRSIRDFATDPVPLGHLSALLNRAARVRGWLGPSSWQATRRASASGGGRHSLELYLVVRNTEGLEPGAYHYDPFDHVLHFLRPWTDEHDQLQRTLLCTPMLVEVPPAISIYLASYYRRAQCKYGGMTLSLLYRDTGCLLQTLYLAAAELGLAGCATAAMQADPSPGFLRDHRDKFIHTGNFAVALPARTEPSNPTFRPLDQ